MAKYNIIQQGDSVQYGIYQAVVDTAADIDSLPLEWSAGSSCIVLEDSSVYMLSNEKVWTEI